MTMMKRKDWEKVLERDEGRCYHCGATTRLVPNHRMNRGIGGSKALEMPANVVTICSWLNSEIESNAEAASLALAWGLKIGGHPVVTSVVVEDIMNTPVYDTSTGLWYLLDNNYQRVLRSL